jgi:hypothetical protein
MNLIRLARATMCYIAAATNTTTAKPNLRGASASRRELLYSPTLGDSIYLSPDSDLPEAKTAVTLTMSSQRSCMGLL